MNVPVVHSDAAVLRTFREILSASGYTEQGLRDLFGSSNPELEHGIFRTVGNSREERALSAFATLFFFGAPIEKQRAREALAPLRLADLAEMGLLSEDNKLVHPNFLVMPHQSLILAADRGVTRKDYVERVDEASRTSSYLTVRRPVSSALDLGTGCGIQALMAARHCSRVTAVDINERALQFADFNAQLNGFNNLEYLTGSWCDPVADRKFDLIVANPPYVISPETEFLFRDSGQPGDAICRQVITDAAAHLDEGGFATILCNWVYDTEKFWSVPLAEWVDESGCDALLLHYGSDDAATYATRWNRGLLRTDPKGFEVKLGRWLDYYRSLGIDTIAYGAVILRKRTGSANRVYTIDVPTGPSGESGDHILRIFAARDLLASAAHEKLLDHVFKLVEGHRLDQVLNYKNSQYSTQPAVMRLAHSIGLEGTVDERALGVLFACDGRRTLRQAIGEASDQLRLEAHELTEPSLAMIGRLLELGLVDVGRT